MAAAAFRVLNSASVIRFRPLHLPIRQLGRMVHFNQAVIRYAIIGASLSGCLRKGTGDIGEPIQDTGRREHEGVGGPPIDSGLRARGSLHGRPL